MNLEEASSIVERHFLFTKTMTECTCLGYMTTKFLLLHLGKYNALLLFHFYTKIYKTLQRSL
jgi:hypothetical protein